MSAGAEAEQRDVTVLVVDDEPSNLSSLRKIFEREQMRVFTAEDAKAALELGRALALHDVGRLQLEPWITDSAMSIAINKDQSGSSHHMCTTRMSDDPGQGVVDRDCCVHGLDNLYIGGSSVFSSPGVSNPTFTIVQLALRLADHLDDRLRKS